MVCTAISENGYILDLFNNRFFISTTRKVRTAANASESGLKCTRTCIVNIKELISMNQIIIDGIGRRRYYYLYCINYFLHEK